ncbi:MAG: hypothetical protein RDV41_11300 [Planctomycetota bacterium]|nr:hypothetical protein [Planctomycetota bacterium]
MRVRFSVAGWVGAALILACLFAATVFAQSKSDLGISATATPAGGVRIQGKGRLRSGDAVVVRLYLMKDEDRILKHCEEFRAGQGGFDVTIQPTGLPTGKYLIEVVAAGQTATACISVETFESVCVDRGKQQEEIVKYWKKISDHSVRLGQYVNLDIRDTIALQSWERLAEQYDRALGKEKLGLVKQEQEMLSTLSGRLIAIAKIARVSLSDTGGYMKRYGMSVVKPDGSFVSVTALVSECREKLLASLRESYIAVSRQLVQKLDEAFQESSLQQGKTKRMSMWEGRTGTWKKLVEYLAEVHCKFGEKSVLYDAALADSVAVVASKLKSIVPPCRALLENKNIDAAQKARDERTKEVLALLAEMEAGKK